MTTPPPRTLIFCKVIDNFGDVGVCGRLAQQLAAEYGHHVTLILDNDGPFRKLYPAGIMGVEMIGWDAFAAQDRFAPTDLVIEAFACDPPDNFVASLAHQSTRPIWLNLEYLSAEKWVEGCHKLASPQSGGLTKHFFMPGFTDKTGGLLREKALLQQRDEFLGDPAAQPTFWQKHGLTPPAEGTLSVSLFSYENSKLPELLAAFSDFDQPVQCWIPAGKILPQLASWAGEKNLAEGSHIHRRNLTCSIIPFMAQGDYDRLLWLCDLNFVRGEDSLVRAIWAGKPFIWHIYPQAADAHAPKLAAFLDQLTANTPAPLNEVIRHSFRWWNSFTDNKWDARLRGHDTSNKKPPPQSGVTPAKAGVPSVSSLVSRETDGVHHVNFSAFLNKLQEVQTVTLAFQQKLAEQDDLTRQILDFTLSHG